MADAVDSLRLYLVGRHDSGGPAFALLAVPLICTVLRSLMNPVVVRRLIGAVMNMSLYKRTCTRVIRHTRVVKGYACIGTGMYRHNNVLIKAVLAHAGRLGYKGMMSGEANISDSDGERALGLPVAATADSNAPRVVLSPSPGAWVVVERGPSYSVSIQVARTDDESKVRTDEVRVMARGRDPQAIADGFIRAAYEGYVSSLTDTSGGPRFALAMRGSGRGGTFVKLPLSDEKTFDTVYNAAVPAVRRLLDEMASGTGKFSVPGHPAKMTFLLHGPPGCGKTSMAKAIAHHTGRHVVIVDLGKMTDNGDLEDIMCSETYATAEDDTERVPNDRVVFLLEDVDASSPAVLRRESAQQKGPGKKGPPGLTLSGVLNVLDGVHDSHRRIVVMTTNRPEALDPAIVRAGRVSLCVEMSYVCRDSAASMLRKYFGDASEESVAGAAAAAAAHVVTPADLEGMCGALASADEVACTIGSSRSIRVTTAPCSICSTP